MARPLIALLTDFGLRDHYVASTKGVILGLCREATLVDISHEIAPHDVAGASHELAACYADFPDDTIFVVVVDPGVGSDRRAIAVDAGGRRYVAPDNGVLTGVLGRAPQVRVFEINNPRYARSSISRTFEGRDRFAPAAAWLASGVDIASLGPPVDPESLIRLPQPRATVNPGTVAGEVVRIDRFGNLVTNIARDAVEELRRRGDVAVSLDGGAAARFVATYADAPSGELCALIGSSNQLEIAVNGASAAARLGASRGARVRVILSAAR